MAAQPPPILKQMACIRRKANLTRKEFLDHHFQIHGFLSDIPQSPDEKPHKYLQTHFFDTAFGSRPNAPTPTPTANHPWVGRDDLTELYFRDWPHIQSCFSSAHVRTVIGPDGANFNDAETAIPLMVTEKAIPFPQSGVREEDRAVDGRRVVAVLFLAVKRGDGEGVSEEVLEGEFSPRLVRALEREAGGEVYGLVANVGIPASRFDVRAYFGGRDMPEYPVAYTIFMKSTASVTAVRRAQKEFVGGLGGRIDESDTFIAFGIQGVILDVGNGVAFDKSRQPKLPDLNAPSHLDH